jgi:hypothetical protein
MFIHVCQKMDQCHLFCVMLAVGNAGLLVFSESFDSLIKSPCGPIVMIN